MKKIFCFFIFALLTLQIVSAVEFDVNTNFDQGETLIAKVSGNFLEPPAKENIFFYRGHVQIPINHYFAKINNEFYIYALLEDKTPNNYSISIENVRYIQGTQTSEEDLVKNFSISNNVAEFSVDPGFVVTDQDFSLEFQNLQDNPIEIEIKRTFGEDKIISLISGEIKEVNLELGNITESVLEVINISSGDTNYEVATYLIAGIDPEDPTTPIDPDDPEPEEPKEDFRFEPSALDFSLPTNSIKTKKIYLYNAGEEDLEDITISISNFLEDYINLSAEEIKRLEKGESARMELTIISDKENIIEGKIIAETADGLTTILDISIEFEEGYVAPSGNGDQETEDPACSEEGGSVCLAPEECSTGESKIINGEVCCLATCEEPKEDSSKKIIGWTLVAFVLILIYYFYKKSKGQTKKKIGFLNFKKK